MSVMRTRAVLAPMPPSKAMIGPTRRAIKISAAATVAVPLAAVALSLVAEWLGMNSTAGFFGSLAILSVFGSFAGAFVCYHFVAKLGRLQRPLTIPEAFASLGEIAGRSTQGIVAVVGRPASISAAPNGEIWQWMTFGYHISLLIDSNGDCVGVTHEHAG